MATTPRTGKSSPPTDDIPPDGFTFPHMGPVAVTAEPRWDDQGDGWVRCRVEHLHGSDVVHLQPAAAFDYARVITDAAHKALEKPLINPNQAEGIILPPRSET